MKCALAVLLLAAGCASSDSTSNAPGIDVSLTQVSSGARDLFYMSGPINLQYGLTVRNPTNEPLTLRRLNLETMSAGAYALHTGSQTVNQPIAPGGETVFRFATWGHARGGYLRAEEPVTIRGTAQFEEPNGHKFQRVFTQTISQF